jgi:hypothetical protein
VTLEITAFCEQRLCKHVSVTTNTHATIELLLENGCSYEVLAEILQARDTSQLLGSSLRKAVKIEHERNETEESPLLGAVAGEDTAGWNRVSGC